MADDSDFIQPQQYNAGIDEQSKINVSENRKIKHKAKVSKKSGVGGFLSLGFSKPVINGIYKIGYKTPTPIQKCAIPVIQSGQDIVAMARTGSGKTACFLLPMFETLKTHETNTGPRALILTPTRELAEQTLRFATKLGKFTGLHCTLVVGGDSMDQQFEALHKDPDIVIATPGRLVHLCAEMGRRLDQVQYVVFDEADRLFEMGFREQLEEILDRLAPTRQTLLFSATLPQMLADFAKAGLNNPVMVRLDKDDKLSEHLKLAFLSVTPNFKLHLLLYILRCVVKKTGQVLVFAATQHHVQYLESILNSANLPCTYLFSDMDPTSRRINTAKFQKKIVNILIATDIAARGIDIPNLDYVINYNFPFNAKVFVHRVGRVARAGKVGTALNFLSSDEEPYLWDLHKFLGRSVLFSPKLETGTMSGIVELDMEPNGLIKKTTESSNNNQGSAESSSNKKGNIDRNFQFGSVPDVILSEEASLITQLSVDPELQYLERKMNNAIGLYERTRPRPTKEAIKEMREMRRLITPGQHPMLLQSIKEHITFTDAAHEMLERRMLITEQFKNRRPNKTIFEIGATGSKAACRHMQEKRKRDDKYIQEYQEKLQQKKAKYTDLMKFKQQPPQLPQVPEDELQYEFPQLNMVQDPMQRQLDDTLKASQAQIENERLAMKKAADEKENAEAKQAEKLKSRNEIDNKIQNGYFIPYQPADMHTERGYSVHDNFSQASRNARLDLLQDNHTSISKVRNQRRKRDHEGTNTRKDSDRKIKTESGRLIKASYKTNRYETWIKRNRIEQSSLENGTVGQQLADDQQLAELQQPQEHQTQAKKNKNSFQVLSTKSSWKVHPLVKENKKILAAKGTDVKEEVRNPQQVKKHRKLQKKYAEDRKRGSEMKKIREKIQGGKKGGSGAPRKSKGNKPSTALKIRNKNKNKSNK